MLVWSEIFNSAGWFGFPHFPRSLPLFYFVNLFSLVMIAQRISLNLPVPNVLFLYPQKLSLTFRELEKGFIGNEWINICNRNMAKDHLVYFSSVFEMCRRIQNPVIYLRWSFFAKIVNSFHLLTIFAKSFIFDVRRVMNTSLERLNKYYVLRALEGSLTVFSRDFE